jgi:hypothetical protein
MKKLVYFFLLICFISINAQTNDSPADNANVILVGGNVSLSFSGGTGPYDLTYTVNGGAPTTVNGVTSPHVLAGLSSGNVVDWYITDTSVPTNSTTTTFTVITSPTPTPANAATGVSQGLASVSWTAFDEGGFGNGNYDVEFYGTDNTYTTPVTQSLDQAGTSFALPALSFNTSYYWRVRDTNIDGLAIDDNKFGLPVVNVLEVEGLSASPAFLATILHVYVVPYANTVVL